MMGWEVLVYPLTATFALVSGITVIYFTYPALILQAAIRYFIYMSGMQVKFVGDEKFVFCYGERGTRQKNKPSILFIHGYTSSKDQWLTVFKKLPKETHMIAMDLPGHGNSGTPREEDDISFDSIIALIHKFVCLVGLDQQPFHLVGTSLGGVLAGLYTAHHPDRVERLTMICPAMKTPVDSEFSREVEKAISLGSENIDESHCRLLPQTPEETLQMLRSCQYHQPKINQQILKGIVALRTPKNRFYLRLFKTLASEENTTILVDHAVRVTPPTQLIWGEHDLLIDKSGAEVLKKIMPNCQRVDIIERCGHSVCLDRPGALVKFILVFRGEYDRKNV